MLGRVYVTSALFPRVLTERQTAASPATRVSVVIASETVTALSIIILLITQQKTMCETLYIEHCGVFTIRTLQDILCHYNNLLSICNKKIKCFDFCLVMYQYIHVIFFKKKTSQFPM